MRLIKFLIIAGTLLFGRAASGQIVLSEIMYDPDTLEYYCEFIEIYNDSEMAVDLQGWFIGTPADTDFIVPAVEGSSIILQPGMYGLILDSGYFTHGLSVYQLPDTNYLLLTIDDGGFGISGLSNSREDTVLLINSDMETVQLYQYLLNNDPGYSDEKIDFQGSNEISNWANSLSFRGTPGYKNSVSIADFNIKIENPEIVNGKCRIKVLNNGLNAIAQNIIFQLFIDLDFNSEFNQNDSLFIENEFFIELESNDSTLIELDGDLNFYGNWYGRIIANISDENPADNFSSGYLNFPILSGALVINELMISPLEYGEWIEIYNSTSNIISLHNLQLLDSR
ncbi:MAG: lamin tail domain-containing protein, partial [Calditrichia bacterium]|nr:lamin tail domain-containing protein [Calditrichia bacterium]